MVGIGWFPLALVLLQIALLIWFVTTLMDIKSYLREIRDLLRQNGQI
jgi:hypothetical protein